MARHWIRKFWNKYRSDDHKDDYEFRPFKKLWSYCNDHKDWTCGKSRDHDYKKSHVEKWGKSYDKFKGLPLNKCKPEPTPNSAPEIVQPESTDLEVNIFNLGTIIDIDAIDADGDQLIFSLEGVDADMFRIDPDTGVLDSNGVPLSIDGSSQGNSTYEVTVVVEDVPDGETDTIDLIIDLTVAA